MECAVEKDETEKGSENGHSEELDTSRGGSLTLFPVDVCMDGIHPKNPLFLYIIPGETTTKKKKCYKFRFRWNSSSTVSRLKILCLVVCSGCEKLFKKQRKDGLCLSLCSRKTDGRHLLSDPFIDHLADCVPLDYDDVIRKSPLVTDIVREKIITGKDISMHLYPKGSPFPELYISMHLYPKGSPFPELLVKDYPVEMAMFATSPVHPMFIYRLPDRPFKCYRFRICSKKCLPDFLVVCVGCASVSKQEKRRSGNSLRRSSRRTDGLRMLSDPLLGHFAGCEPIDYKQCIEGKIPH